MKTRRIRNRGKNPYRSLTIGMMRPKRSENHSQNKCRHEKTTRRPNITLLPSITPRFGCRRNHEPQRQQNQDGYDASRPETSPPQPLPQRLHFSQNGQRRQPRLRQLGFVRGKPFTKRLECLPPRRRNHLKISNFEDRRYAQFAHVPKRLARRIRHVDIQCIGSFLLDSQTHVRRKTLHCMNARRKVSIRMRHPSARVRIATIRFTWRIRPSARWQQPHQDEHDQDEHAVDRRFCPWPQFADHRPPPTIAPTRLCIPIHKQVRCKNPTISFTPNTPATNESNALRQL